MTPNGSRRELGRGAPDAALPEGGGQIDRSRMKIDVEISVRVRAGYPQGPVKSAIQSRLKDLIDPMARGQTVYRSMLLAAVQGVDGVAEAELRGPHEDVFVPADRKPAQGRFRVLFQSSAADRVTSHGEPV